MSGREGQPIPFASVTQEQLLVIPRPSVVVIPDKARTNPEGGDRFSRIPSGVEGVDLIVEPGTSPEFPPGTVRRLQADTDRIATFRGYQTVFDGAKARLQRVAERTGFRGVSSVRGNYDATIYPSQDRSYDPQLLKESTGEFHKELVREEARVEVIMPIGTEEDSIQKTEALARTIAFALMAEGRPADQVLSMVTPTVVQRLDEQRLNQLVAQEKIKLKLGTLRKVVSQWNTPVRQKVQRLTPRRQRRKLKV